MLQLEFGQPRLDVGQPKERLLRLASHATRVPMRRARAVGEFTLEILYCQWDIRLDDEVVAHCESDEHLMARVLRFLDGQELTGVSFDDMAMETTFLFDLGARLTTSPALEPYGNDAALWTLHAPGGAWSLGEDGTVRTGERQGRQASNTRPLG